MLDPVGSTSWHNRHLPQFIRLNELLAASDLREPTILIVGPGGVTRWLSPLLNDAARPDAAPPRRLIGDLARYLDQLLRRIPGIPLRTLEPVEVQRAIYVPHRLVVADRSARVLAAAARDVPEAKRYQVDIARQPVPIQADVVIAFNIVCRLDHPAAGMRHIVAALRPRGLLLMDDRSAEAHLPRGPFRRIAAKTHQQTTSPDSSSSDSNDKNNDYFAP